MTACKRLRFFWLGSAMVLSLSLGACATRSEAQNAPAAPSDSRSTDPAAPKAPNSPNEAREQEAPECTRYRLMSTAPMPPDAMQRLRDACLEATTKDKSEQEK